MKDQIYASHLAGDAPNDPWSDEGRTKPLNIEVTAFVLAGPSG
jgi:hypothetical protein